MMISLSFAQYNASKWTVRKFLEVPYSINLPPRGIYLDRGTPALVAGLIDHTLG